MTGWWGPRVRLAVFGWLATVLTSLAFFPALEDKTYVVKGAALAALAVGVGIACRAVRLPAIAVIAAQLLVLAEATLLSFGEAFAFGVVPTRATFAHLDDLLRRGFEVAQQYPAPAPSDPGLLLMVVFAIGIVAVAVDALALGLGRVPLAGLPLLALYTIPVAALPDGVPWFAFVPGAAAYIGMLTLDERDRLAHWGRLVSRDSATAEASEIDTSGLHATGRQVSMLALAIAVVVPIFLPALSSSILDSGREGAGGEGGGGSVLSFDDPFVSLEKELRRQDPVNLIEVRSRIVPQYLRLVALNDPGPNAWTATPQGLTTAVPVGGVYPPPTGQDDGLRLRDRTMSITLADGFPGDSSWLPVPFGLVQVAVTAPFSYVIGDQTVRASAPGAIASLDPYTVDYRKPAPTAAQLSAAGPPPADIASTYASVPDGVPAVVGETAREVTASADTAYEQALALQSYFRKSGEFSYDVRVGYGSGYESMARFLEAGKGFCQQYAATMAMMARTLGIPSRVMVGFLQTSEREGNAYVFTSESMHAWPELYFDGIGWVGFEPTPGLAAPYPTYAQGIDGPAGPSGGRGDDDQGDVGRETASATPEPEAATSTGTGSGGGPGPSGSGFWLGVLVVMALLLLPAALRASVRHARLTRPVEPDTAAESAWLELRDHVRDLRLPWDGSMTPRARERDLQLLIGDDHDAHEALHRLAISVERARYAARPTVDAAPAEDARSVMATISRRADRFDRWRAFWWPSSLMPDLRRGWARVRARVLPAGR